jgi:4-amino-4-deoxy-L-arabinose transferase-like glycosyltransferase
MWTCLLLLVAMGFAVRVWGLTHQHFWDENVYLLNAERFSGGHAGYDEIDSRPPLLSLLYVATFRVWHSDYAAAIVTALLNALGPLFLYLAGRKVGSRTAAAVAALLLALGPFFVGVCSDGHGGFVSNCNGHSLLADCPAVTLLCAALWLGFRALERGRAWRFLPVGLVLALAVLMRFGSLSSAGILMLMALAAERRILAVLACSAGFTLGFGPYLLWSRIHYGGFLETLSNGWDNLGGPAYPPWYYLGVVPEMLTWVAVAGLVLWLARRILDARRAAANGSGWNWRRWLGPKTIPEFFLVLWAVAATVFFCSLNHKEPRYIMPVAPPLLLLAGLGLETLTTFANQRLRWAGRLVLAMALLVVLWPAHHRFDDGFMDDSVSDEMTLAGWLQTNVHPDAILYANQNYPDIAYYSGLKVLDLPESGPKLPSALAAMPAKSLLVAYRANDDGEDVPPEPAIEDLDRNPRYQRLTELPTLVLYRVQ